jgi:hypothetical protein
LSLYPIRIVGVFRSAFASGGLDADPSIAPCYVVAFMARTEIETKFAHALGRIGEEKIAPGLLQGLGIIDLRNLNDFHPNHPWADYVGKRNGEWVAVAVRTRVNWQKPSNGSAPRLRTGFGGAGFHKAEKAVRLIRSYYGLSETVEVRLLWLAIAIDIDNTYEAYWGPIAEMRLREDGSRHLTIRMDEAARDRYTRDGRRIAWREPCVAPWEQFPDEWACPARHHYLNVSSQLTREERIEAAVRAVSSGLVRRTVFKTSREPLVVTGEAHGRRVEPACLFLPQAREESPVQALPAKSGARYEKAIESQHDLEPLLGACRNPAEEEFFRKGLRQGQPTTEVGLSYWVEGRSRWCVDICQEWARVVQKGRFADDEAFWRSRVSEPRTVGTKRSGSYLIFRLVTRTDFAVFERFAAQEAAGIVWRR